jgi:hypothetical protein
LTGGKRPMNRAELLERANRYRYLAASIFDEQTRAGLFDLADRYEALAWEVEQRTDPSS